MLRASGTVRPRAPRRLHQCIARAAIVTENTVSTLLFALQGGQALIRVRLAIGEARACLDHAGRSLAAEWDAAVASEASVEVDEHRGGAAEDLAVLGCEEEDATRWTGLRAEVEDLLSRAVGWAPPSTLDG